jgi:hypothetical protein
MERKPFKFVLNNLRDENIYLLFTADAVSGSTGITVNQPICITAVTDNTLVFDYVNSGRLYFVEGPIYSGTPIGPNTAYYYSWIEFSQKHADITGNTHQFWVNLTNVDVSAMQLSLSGTATDGTTFSLGYEKSANDIIKYCKDNFVGSINNTGKPKVIAPNVNGKPYPRYNDYFKSLVKSNAAMTIVSDGSPAVTFTGNFCETVDNIGLLNVLLKDVNGNTIKIYSSAITSDIIYRCDGATLYYNDICYPENRGDSGATAVVTNSVFRNIMIGLNEGYFSTTGTNSTCDFAAMTPFTNGGNDYAEYIHSVSNSYGYPYADNNLKVLVTPTASTETALYITICKDDTPFGYTAGKFTPQTPSCGNYEINIGQDSNVGKVTCDNLQFPQQENGAYMGYIPKSDDWNKIWFDDGVNKNYILYNTKDIQTGATEANVIWSGANGQSVLVGAPPQWQKLPAGATGEYTLNYGSNVTINPLANNPIEPQKKSCWRIIIAKILEYIIFWNKWSK